MSDHHSPTPGEKNNKNNTPPPRSWRKKPENTVQGVSSPWPPVILIDDQMGNTKAAMQGGGCVKDSAAH